MELSQGNKQLLSLAKGAFTGEVMLPDFQRNFIWARQDIEELIKSLLENMFIGNFLIHNVNPLDPPFKPIAIEGAQMVNPNYTQKPTILILDGQQRLSSFFYALYAPNIPLKNASNPYAFFINIRALLYDDVENSVFSTSKVWRHYTSLKDEHNNFKMELLVAQEIIPCTFIKEDFTEIWYENYKENYSKEEDKKIRDYIRNITNYKALTLDVPVNEKPENIAVLFERINRTGVKLSVFDLLVARLYKFINLRESWENAFDNSERIKKYALHNKRNTSIPYYFIQSLALHHSLSIKARDMLKINAEILNKNTWETIVSIVETKVLIRLLDINEYGIARVDKWFPYSPIIVPFISFFMKENQNIPKINKWYWASVFSERYSGSVEGKLTKDYKEVVQWFTNDDNIPEVVRTMHDIVDKTFNLLDKKNAGNSVYKGVFNLLFKNDALDFYEEDKLKYAKTDLDDHHIFPKKFLEEKGVTENVNTILNRTLILGTTNKSISKKSPAEYVQIMLEKHKSTEKVKTLLKTHFINDDMFEIMKTVNDNTPNEEVQAKYDRFLQLREIKIKEKIKELV
ncbi:conserved protein of unknown function [Tenacibaculum sp. 190524A02b]|uniref:GmrSD restriction endonuclease domain-containing protein n=1 Tax=Tenacibaculum vairaonense TaxID=3137860 RepID=UPI0032B1E353